MLLLWQKNTQDSASKEQKRPRLSQKVATFCKVEAFTGTPIQLEVLIQWLAMFVKSLVRFIQVFLE